MRPCSGHSVRIGAAESRSQQEWYSTIARLRLATDSAVSQNFGEPQGCSKDLSTGEPVAFHSVIGGIPIYSALHTQSDGYTHVTAAIPRSITPATAHLVDRTRRHIALRLLPFLFILYITNYLDRTSVAYAAIGMSRDLGIQRPRVWFGRGHFFHQLCGLADSRRPAGGALERPADDLRHHDRVGIADGADGAGAHSGQLYLARFLLGAAEAGFFPGVIVYLSHWFIREDRAKATSNFMGAIPLSFVIGSPIAGWILGHSWLAFAGWRWLFILEGMPAILLGAVAFFFSNRLGRAKRPGLLPSSDNGLNKSCSEEKPASERKRCLWGRRSGLGTILLLASVCLS